MINRRLRTHAGWLALCLPLAGWTAPASASAAQPETSARSGQAGAIVEEIVVTGQKTTGGEFGAKSGIPLEKLPQSVQVLDAQALLDRGVYSVGEALRAVPSANIGNSRVSSYQSFSLKVRGFLADQMRNGVRQRYYEDVDSSALSNVERIEVLKGPSSVLFGQSAVGGLISLVTKRPQRAFGANVSLAAGSYDRKSGAFDLTGPLTDSLFYRITGEVERSSTFVDYQDEERENLGVSLTWEAGDRLTAYLVTEWIQRDSLRYPGQPFIGTEASNGVSRISRSTFFGEPEHADLKSKAPLVQAWADIVLGEDWTLTPRISHSGFYTRFVQTRVRGMQADGVTVNRNGRFGREDDDYTIGQLDLKGDIEFGGVTHNLLMGVEYDRERSTFLQYNIAAVPAINTLNPQYAFRGSDPAFVFAFDLVGNIDGWAGYLQDMIDITDRWNVIGGLRWSDFDMHSRFNDAVDDSKTDALTWQVGTTYALNDAWSLFAGYNTGIDLESTASSRDRSGDQFEPEESDQLEAGVRYSSDAFRGSLSAFRVREKNALTTDPIDPDFLTQTGKIRVQGIEIEGELKLADALWLQGGYAWMDNEILKSNDGDEGEELGDTPEHQASLFLRYATPLEGLELRGGMNVVGSRLLVNASDEELDNYVTVDAAVSYDFGETRIELLVNNLLDEVYYTASGNGFAVVPGDPRQVTLRLHHSFR